MPRSRTRLPIAALCALTCVLPAFARRQQEVTRNFDRTVELPAGHQLRIESKFGEVKVRGMAQRDVVIHATIRTAAGSPAEAEELANKVRIEVNQSPSGVSVRTVYPERNSGWFNSKNTSYSVNLDVTYPESAPLEIRNEFGEVRVSECKGGARIVNGHGALSVRNGKGIQNLENSFGAVEVAGNDGDVVVSNGNGAIIVSDVTGRANVKDRFGRITVTKAGQGATIVNNNGAVTLTDSGGASNITNSFGAVTATGIRGDLTVRNSNGAVDAHNVTGSAWLANGFGAISASEIGKSLDATGSNGAISAHRVGGLVTVRTSFGATDIQDSGGVDVTSGNGTVKAIGVRGAAKVHTSFGGITVENVSGPVDASNSNGSITVTSNATSGCQPITLKTTFGPIKLALPANANYNVSATTSFGGINTEFPVSVAGQTTSESIQGKIGNGGCELKITNSNGRIDIVKR
jgi:hypothetical protein